MKLHPDLVRGIRIGSGIGGTMIVMAAVSVLVAQSIKVFSAGELISATNLNANFAIAAPEGVVAAFMLSSCPTGWIPADGGNGSPDLRGRFIRGRDDMGTGAAGNDSGGTRAVGDIQSDSFQGHRHGISHTNVKITNGSIEEANTIMRGWTSATGDTLTVQDPTVDGTNGTPRTANETRPKNVTLIFCMRKNT